MVEAVYLELLTTVNNKSSRLSNNRLVIRATARPKIHGAARQGHVRQGSRLHVLIRQVSFLPESLAGRLPHRRNRAAAGLPRMLRPPYSLVSAGRSSDCRTRPLGGSRECRGTRRCVGTAPRR